MFLLVKRRRMAIGLVTGMNASNAIQPCCFETEMDVTHPISKKVNVSPTVSMPNSGSSAGRSFQKEFMEPICHNWLLGKVFFVGV